ncbi:nucleotide pyrophosphohydrolase [Rubrivivax gelatinosus]|uniref:nucleotide pyrophosphohydrolase n=1 Tax=Rubrivivax gelatinosus TaxID=28068 RepID=UPI000318CC11|nr:nucleotide pyrophosphohydrolase [Rubrivivax gelatinosus]MBG6082895.1 NTP pyrophosphatase (non-canonical NTP hydrolase) [Rubrivivax gelatinosus]
MNVSELQAELRHFAAERDWQPFHTPKNLSTALMVEAAELAEIFQWMTPEQSARAHEDPAVKQRIGEEVADVLLYLLQLADHSRIDIAQAVKDKLALNAAKYPPLHTIARIPPARAAAPGPHVLVDYENVQPTEGELRELVPGAGQVWVFHGPHQHEVDRRFASFGTNATAVPISRTGKNALDFHLSFYLGYIASRNPGAPIVVVANDKGYEPMIEHARGMGFAVQRLTHGQVKPAASNAEAPSPAAKPAAKSAPAKKGAAKKVPVKKAAPKKAAAKKAPAKKVAAKKATAAKKTAVATTSGTPATKKAAMPVGAEPAKQPGEPETTTKPAKAASSALQTMERLSNSLRKMGDKRPTKLPSLRRSLKSFLGIDATDDAVSAALNGLVAAGVVQVDDGGRASYPSFGGA